MRLEAIKELLTDAELAAIDTLAGAGWRPMTEAFIGRGKTADSDYPTHRIGGTYVFVLALPNLIGREKRKPKPKRGRPKKQ